MGLSIAITLSNLLDALNMGIELVFIEHVSLLVIKMKAENVTIVV